MKGIADTGFLVAFVNRRDRHHEWALELAGQVFEPLLTCEAVLAEASFHLRNAGLVLALVSEGLVTPQFDVAEQLPRLVQLAARYADRKPDLADLCLIRLSEMHPKHRVLTVDADDFRIYRRNRNETIPLLVPPGLH
jgi:predicted nucleic acid-binding protein